MGVRVVGGTGRGEVRGSARACGGAAPVSRRRAQQSAVTRGAALPLRRAARARTAPLAYYATRARSLVLCCFMMVRHESARYADVP